MCVLLSLVHSPKRFGQA